VPLAQKAVAGKADRADSLTTLGAALYRDAQFEAAVTQLQRARDAAGQDGSVEAELFLAMAHQRLDHPDLAKTSLAEATEHLDKALKPADKEARLPSWEERLRWETLRREAQAVVKPAHP
jgi:Flp pilus assembly protein TadD